MIYADSDCILVPEDHGKQNLEESYTSKYQNVFLTVMAINYYVLMISLVSPLRHT